jgi:hypothetical protein
MIGIACCWIGVGVVYPSSFKAFNKGSMRLRCWNDKMILFNIEKSPSTHQYPSGVYNRRLSRK